MAEVQIDRADCSAFIAFALTKCHRQVTTGELSTPASETTVAGSYGSRYRHGAHKLAVRARVFCRRFASVAGGAGSEPHCLRPTTWARWPPFLPPALRWQHRYWLSLRSTWWHSQWPKSSSATWQHRVRPARSWLRVIMAGGPVAATRLLVAAGSRLMAARPEQPGRRRRLASNAEPLHEMSSSGARKTNQDSLCLVVAVEAWTC